jgi:hypothetical protein
MLNRIIGIAFSALLAAGAFGLASTTAARAESIMKTCGDEWKAAKANNTTGGKTWPEFLSACRTAHESAPAAAAAPAAAPAPAPAAAAPAAAPAPMAAKPVAAKPMAKATARGAGEFPAAAEAKGHCPSDTVVWVNTKTKVFHYSGHPSYGNTKKGAYMCEADATAAGDRASKSEKPKQ